MIINEIGMLFVASTLLGFVFNASPGIVTAEAVRRGIAHGFWSALLLELGSLIGDASWAIMALVGIAFIVDYPLIQLVLGVVGTALLLHLAWGALMSARRGDVPQGKANPSKRGDFATGAALSLTNPFAIAFWLAVGNSTISTHVNDPQPVHLIIFLGAFMLSGFVWCFILAALVTWGRRIITPTFFRIVNLICGLVLVYFGISLLWSTLTSVFS